MEPNPSVPPGLEAYGWPPEPRANWMLVGHEDAERTLLEAYGSERLHHAWLLCGDRGIGKATLAFRFARYLLAEGGAGESAPLDLFGEAPKPDHGEGLAVAPGRPVFRRVASGGHADLFTVERRINEKTGRLRSEIVVEDVRGVVSFLTHTAAEGGWRAVVIDGAEDMNRSAANAVLKVLEEPPTRTVLLLVSHQPGRLLPTIRSRCRRLLLKPPDMAVATDLLTRFRPDLGTDAARALLDLADGSIGTALSLVDVNGLALHDDVVAVLSSLPRLDMAALDRLGDRVTKEGAEGNFPVITGLFNRWLVRLARAATLGVDQQSESAAAAESAMVERLAAAASLERWLQVWDNTSALLARAEGANLDRRQVILELFLNVRSAVGG
ncbi:MAG: DNA polymerase III subunit delta' [Rhodospirillales bacterium]|nr:DNA polymerase III subunit delta' [Rhodospirillales bacterium]